MHTALNLYSKNLSEISQLFIAVPEIMEETVSLGENLFKFQKYVMITFLFTHLFFPNINIKIYLTVHIVRTFTINVEHIPQVEKFIFMQINERCDKSFSSSFLLLSA